MEKKRVCIYTRSSTSDQYLKKTVKGQERECRKYIETKKDWELIKVYSDSGISGSEAYNRPEFTAMMQDIEKGLIDIVVATEQSRLSRSGSQLDRAIIFDTLEKS